MAGVKEYIFTICGASLICAIARKFLGDKGSTAGIGKMIIGLFLLVTIVKPVLNLRFNELQDLSLGAQTDAIDAVWQGEEFAKQQMAAIIKERTAAYILQKAQQLDVSLEVEVQVSDDEVPVPEKVIIAGNISSFAKQQLQLLIEQELGISKECQVWI